MAGQGCRVRPVAACPLRRRFAGCLQIVLGHLGERRGDRLLGGAAADQLGLEAETSLRFLLQTVAHEVAGRADVVEISLGDEAVESRLDLLFGIAALRELRFQLGPEMRAGRQQPDGPVVTRNVLQSSNCDPPVIRSSLWAWSASSICSREMSAVNCTPWIFKRNSSGFVARLSASSSVIRPLLKSW